MRRAFRIRREDFRPVRRQRTPDFTPWQFLRMLVRGLVPLVCVLCIAGIVYFFFFSRSFSIDIVDVAAGKGVDSSQVKSIVYAQMDKKKFFIAPEKNIFLFDDKKVMNDLHALFAVDTLRIQKKMPNKVVVTIEARPLQILWYSAGKLYDIDGQGSVARESQMFSLLPVIQNLQVSTTLTDAMKRQITMSVPIVIDEENKGSSLTGTILSETAVAYLVAAKKSLEGIGVQPLYIKAKRNTATFTIVTSERWEVYLTTDEPLEQQIASVQTLLSEKIRNKRHTLRYIDARFGNRLYYTFK